MQYRITLVLAAVIVVTAGCTSTGSAPATAPPTTERVPTTTTTTSPRATSTTLAPATTIDREAEIEAIFHGLEQRRLEAIYSGDTEAFVALFADTPYLARSLEVFDYVEPGPVPDITIEILEVLRDDHNCLAAVSRATVGSPGKVGPVGTTVLTRTDASDWSIAFAYEGREGWLCEEPHPLSAG